MGQRFFEAPWIDARLQPGKSGGAFAHPTVPSAHPYLLLNYHGRTRDVMTLAHELGHGVHQVLAADQGYLMSGTPLTLAETASVFGEMLTFRAMLDAEASPARRRIMLAAKVEDMLNTVVRQTAFYRFETLLHDERRGGELLPERIGEIWRQVQTESLGPGVRVHARIRRVLGLRAALHPFAVLRLRLCLRRLPGERAVCGVPVRASWVPGEIPGHAAGRRHASGTRNCWRRSGSMPPTRRSGNADWT